MIKICNSCLQSVNPNEKAYFRDCPCGGQRYEYSEDELDDFRMYLPDYIEDREELNVREALAVKYFTADEV